MTTAQVGDRVLPGVEIDAAKGGANGGHDVPATVEPGGDVADVDGLDANVELRVTDLAAPFLNFVGLVEVACEADAAGVEIAFERHAEDVATFVNVRAGAVP